MNAEVNPCSSTSLLNKVLNAVLFTRTMLPGVTSIPRVDQMMDSTTVFKLALTQHHGDPSDNPINPGN